MDRLILPLLGAVFLLILGGAGPLAWDRHPPIGWHLRVLGMSVVGFDLPDSLKTQRDKAYAARDAAIRAEGAAISQRAQCDANLALARRLIDVQNAAIEGLRRDSAARMARSAKATEAARVVAESARVHAQTILEARPGSADLCQAADALILKEAGR